MARGGARQGAGRPKGKPNSGTIELKRALSHAEGRTLTEKLAFVVEDTTVPWEVQLAAARHLNGVIHGHAIRLRVQSGCEPIGR